MSTQYWWDESVESFGFLHIIWVFRWKPQMHIQTTFQNYVLFQYGGAQWELFPKYFL